MQHTFQATPGPPKASPHPEDGHSGRDPRKAPNERVPPGLQTEQAEIFAGEDSSRLRLIETARPQQTGVATGLGQPMPLLQSRLPLQPSALPDHQTQQTRLSSGSSFRDEAFPRAVTQQQAGYMTSLPQPMTSLRQFILAACRPRPQIQQAPFPPGPASSRTGIPQQQTGRVIFTNPRPSQPVSAPPHYPVIHNPRQPGPQRIQMNSADSSPADSSTLRHAPQQSHLYSLSTAMRSVQRSPDPMAQVNLRHQSQQMQPSPSSSPCQSSMAQFAHQQQMHQTGLSTSPVSSENPLGPPIQFDFHLQAQQVERAPGSSSLENPRPQRRSHAQTQETPSPRLDGPGSTMPWMHAQHPWQHMEASSSQSPGPIMSQQTETLVREHLYYTKMWRDFTYPWILGSIGVMGVNVETALAAAPPLSRTTYMDEPSPDKYTAFWQRPIPCRGGLRTYVDIRSWMTTPAQMDMEIWWTLRGEMAGQQVDTHSYNELIKRLAEEHRVMCSHISRHTNIQFTDWVDHVLQAIWVPDPGVTDPTWFWSYSGMRLDPRAHPYVAMRWYEGDEVVQDEEDERADQSGQPGV